MNPKQQEALAKRLVELLISIGIFKKEDCKACVGGIHTDIHTWITMKETIEQVQLVRAIKDAISIYEGESLAKAWAKHVKDSGT